MTGIKQIFTTLVLAVQVSVQNYYTEFHNPDKLLQPANFQSRVNELHPGNIAFGGSRKR
jgi:hypothetical protein